ncbi:PepSY-like domain-containing protein [Porphyromonas sp.]|uniref:PepSY-like domain-containing protein n=1 Tax=Porphyromonas sp. TaxID=1924944 RepID=UPI0026DB62C3|nr:PepSY-like domain-containing protein [Porphyromonas sp.]MDO4771379.1 PepSY-like domain-containing protein [Porphyromonas sp.]
MVRKILFALMLTASMLFVGKAEDRPIRFEQLPEAAKAFVRTHFNESDVTLVLLDKEVLSTSYEVKLVDGMSIDFDAKGEWKDVDGGFVEVPSAIIPAKIASFVNANHARTKIVKISRNRRFYEVELNNDLEIVFDRKTMEFKRYDN